MVRVMILTIATLLLGAVAGAATPYHDFYADAVWNDLTGFSTMQSARAGLRAGANDYYLYLKNEYYDTTGTDLPFQESAEGTGVGVGYRYWFPGNHLFATVSGGVNVAGKHEGEGELRAGLAGYNAWEAGKHYTDLYGELFWVERAEDTLLNIRYRPGITLKRDDDGRLWTYGVGQLWASGSGDYGTENRAEAGIGLGYISDHGWSASVELREGYSYRGNIDDKAYFNPTIVLAGYW